MRIQFITHEKKGSDVWRFDGTLFMHRPNARDFTRNLLRICHISHNLQQICHTYIILYIKTIMHVCSRLADFLGKNSGDARIRNINAKLESFLSQALWDFVVRGNGIMDWYVFEDAS